MSLQKKINTKDTQSGRNHRLLKKLDKTPVEQAVPMSEDTASENGGDEMGGFGPLASASAGSMERNALRNSQLQEQEEAGLVTAGQPQEAIPRVVLPPGLPRPETSEELIAKAIAASDASWDQRVATLVAKSDSKWEERLEGLIKMQDAKTDAKTTNLEQRLMQDIEAIKATVNNAHNNKGNGPGEAIGGDGTSLGTKTPTPTTRIGMHLTS